MNKYDYFFLAGLALQFAETWYFGWNLSAQSAPEKMFDLISIALIAYGVLGGVGSSIKTVVNINADNIRP